MALRASRESQGISLEEASRVTRIGKNYLTALEGDSFDTLPNPAYAKGFLRAYAAFLGLSGNDVVARYEESLPGASQACQQEEEKRGDGAPVVREVVTASRRGRRWGVPLVLLVSVIVAAFIFEDKGSQPAKGTPVPAVPQSVPVATPALPVRSSAQKRPEFPDLSAKKEKGDIRTPEAESQGTGIVLKLKVNQDCWLNITIDDTVSQQYDLKAGDLIEWKGDRSFALDLGNAGGIEAEFNGKSLKPFGGQGKPVHVVLKADGTTE